jgi:hypothetical protein
LLRALHGIDFKPDFLVRLFFAKIPQNHIMKAGSKTTKARRSDLKSSQQALVVLLMQIFLSSIKNRSNETGFSDKEPSWAIPYFYKDAQPALHSH